MGDPTCGVTVVLKPVPGCTTQTFVITKQNVDEEMAKIRESVERDLDRRVGIVDFMICRGCGASRTVAPVGRQDGDWWQVGDEWRHTCPEPIDG